MQVLSRVVGPIATNVVLLADERSREAIAIDTAIPSLDWIAGELAERGWTLKLIVSTHGHWDHIGDNAAVAAHTGADIAVHPADRDRLTNPQPLWAPFDIPPSVPAVELAEGGFVRFGEIRLEVLHTPGHTEGSVCLLASDAAVLSAATPCSPAAGAGSTCLAARPRRWSSRSAGWRRSRTRSGSCRATVQRRRSGASGSGWSSSPASAGCSPSARTDGPPSRRAGRFR